MKAPFLFASLAAAFLFAGPEARAIDVGKLAGNYAGDGLIVDKRNESARYRYTFKPASIKVQRNGTITGSSDVKIDVSIAGSPYFTVGRQTLSGKGKVTRLKVTSNRITGTGTVKFSNGMKFSGPFSVAITTGKGTFKFEEHTSEYDAKVVLKKQK